MSTVIEWYHVYVFVLLIIATNNTGQTILHSAEFIVLM